MNKAVFYDRDGVLNKLISRDGGLYSPRKISQFSIFPESIEVTKYTKKMGFLNIIVSNQPDIARGLMSKKTLDNMTKVIFRDLKIDDVFYCIHDDNQCRCRKPLDGLIINAKKKWNIDLSQSIMVGDTKKDFGAAKNAGIDFILVSKEYNQKVDCTNKVQKLIQIKKYI